MNKLIIGTRGSQLALWQSKYIKKLLESRHPGLEVELKIISTRGDKIQDVPLPKIGAKGLFTEEIEAQLLNHSIHLAVHSLKDLPTTLPEGLLYIGSPWREDPRDAFISHIHSDISHISSGGVIATGSMRRKALFSQTVKNIRFADLRGNIDTRLRKLKENGWDGIIMASAALHRLGMKNMITQYLDPEIFVPAVGQGAVGLEIAEDRHEVRAIVETVCHDETTRCCTAERMFMKNLEGGCSVPLGCWGRMVDTKFTLTGYAASPDGSRYIRESVTGKMENTDDLAVRLSEIFIQKGAREMLRP